MCTNSSTTTNDNSLVLQAISVSISKVLEP